MVRKWDSCLWQLRWNRLTVELLRSYFWLLALIPCAYRICMGEVDLQSHSMKLRGTLNLHSSSVAYRTNLEKDFTALSISFLICKLRTTPSLLSWLKKIQYSIYNMPGRKQALNKWQWLLWCLAIFWEITISLIWIA